jgi:cytoskeletal protein CcmA (bactofilin family)
MKRVVPLLLLVSFAATTHAALLSDRLWAGCPIRIDTAVDGDVIAAGCEVRVDAKVDGKLRAAGGEVQVAPDAMITGGASVAGGEVTVKGTIQGDLRAAGGQVTVDATVDGDVNVAAGEFRLGPNAKIGGKLTYRAGEFTRTRERRSRRGSRAVGTARSHGIAMGSALTAAIRSPAGSGPRRS